MLYETHHAPPRYKIPEFFSSLLDMVEVETCLTTDTFAFEPGMQLAGSVAKSAERDARCGRVDGTKRRLFWIRQCVA
jgi:hypothetical protein